MTTGVKTTKIGRSHTSESEEYERHSEDLGDKDFGGRNTDKMSPADVTREHSFDQGGHNSGVGNTITTEAIKTVIPGSDKQMGPRNIPNYVHPDNYKKGEKPAESSSTGLV